MAIDTATDGTRKRRLVITTATAQDRDRVFRRARRHTLLVKALRGALPIIALASIGVYVAAVMSGPSGPVDTTPSLATTRILPENLTMDNPVYDSFGKDGSRYVIRAKTAVTNMAQTAPIRLNVITGEITQPNGVVTHLSSNWGLFDRTKGVLDLFERIDIDASNGMKARLTQAHVYPKDSRIVSNERSMVEMTTGTVRGDKLEFNSKARTATFVGAVETQLKPAPKHEGTDTPTKAVAPKAPDVKMTDMMMRSDAPIDILSDRLDINDITKIAIFKDNVRAKQGEAGLTSSELEVRYAGKAELTAEPRAPPLDPTAAKGADATRLTLLLARGGVVLTKADSRAESTEAMFDATADTAVLLGNLVMTSGSDRKVTGERADLDQRKDTALVTGAEVVTIQGPNILRGRRLFVDRKAGTSRLDSPASPGVPAGRIAAHLVQKEKDANAAKAEAKDAGSAPAVPAFMSGSFKSDPSAPMDVDADVLNVDDRRKTATFNGNVIARQGTFEVRSSELVAHYTGETGLMASTPAPTAPGATPAKTQSQLTKIETRQKVLISGNDGQTVTGNWAVFDAKTNLATVGGDVVVGQGKNVVRGPLLKINLTTGHYNFVQEPTANPWTTKDGGPGATTSTAPKSDADATKTSRPSMLIYPKDLKEAQQQKKADSASGSGPKAAAEPGGRPSSRPPDPAPGWKPVPAARPAPATATESGN